MWFNSKRFLPFAAKFYLCFGYSLRSNSLKLIKCNYAFPLRLQVRVRAPCPSQQVLLLCCVFYFALTGLHCWISPNCHAASHLNRWHCLLFMLFTERVSLFFSQSSASQPTPIPQMNSQLKLSFTIQWLLSTHKLSSWYTSDLHSHFHLLILGTTKGIPRNCFC